MMSMSEEKRASDKQRLNKYLAACGVCSRREADRLVEEGAVTINGIVAKPGDQVAATDLVCVRGKEVEQKKQRVVLAYYKPTGITCTQKDQHAEKTVADVLKYPVRVTYAGRLDKESEGLLLMTNDGDLIDRMMRGANGHEKEYVVRVNREVTDLFLHQLTKGVYLEELKQTTRPCQAERIGKYTFRIVLTQGLNRQIRRMCRAFQFHVISIKRVRVMNVELGDLKPGEYREVTGAERDALYRQCGMM